MSPHWALPRPSPREGALTQHSSSWQVGLGSGSRRRPAVSTPLLEAGSSVLNTVGDTKDGASCSLLSSAATKTAKEPWSRQKQAQACQTPPWSPLLPTFKGGWEQNGTCP